MPKPTPNWIAELRVIIVHPDGRRVPGHIAVGQPYALGDGRRVPGHSAVGQPYALGGADQAASYESRV